MDSPSKGFADRLTYLRWLWTLEQRAFGDHGDFAKFIGVPPVLYYKWKDSAVASSDRGTGKRFLAGGLASLGASDVWLLDGEGEAPRPQLWAIWTREEGGEQAKPADPPPIVAIPMPRPTPSISRPVRKKRGGGR